jgi:hypothetical protein
MVDVLKFDAVELKPSFELETGRADGGNRRSPIELIHINNIFFEILFMDGGGRWWSRFLGLFFLLGLFGFGFLSLLILFLLILFLFLGISVFLFVLMEILLLLFFLFILLKDHEFLQKLFSI